MPDGSTQTIRQALADAASPPAWPRLVTVADLPDGACPPGTEGVVVMPAYRDRDSQTVFPAHPANGTPALVVELRQNMDESWFYVASVPAAKAGGGTLRLHPTEFRPLAPAAVKKPQIATREQSRQAGYEGDPCKECQALMLVRNGPCMKCDNCGATTGCS